MAIFNTVPPLKAGSGIQFDGEVISTRSAPHNYLDNSNFTNPVNQRGKTTYTGIGYTIDRWRLWSDEGSLSVVAGGVTVSGQGLYTYLSPEEINKDGMYTLAVKTADGAIDVVSGTPSSKLVGTKCLLNFDQSVNLIAVKLEPGYTYVWAALYKGEYTKDTLPPYQPKGYAAELAECLRYFERVNVHDTGDGAPTLYKHIRFTNKRAIPTVSWVMTQSENLNGNNVGNWSVTINDANGVHALVKDKTEMAYWYGYADVSADL